MTHADVMIGRLPRLYREGELVGQVLEQPGLQIEILDQEAVEVQRAHFFDSALNLDEAAGLAALLDIAPEPWQELAEFRAWVHSLRDAMLRKGVVTPAALQEFVADYTRRYQAANRIEAVRPIETWSRQPSDTAPAFVENPRRRRLMRAPDNGGVEPLYQFTIEQGGMDETHASLLLTGLPSAPESAPLIANLTTGQALLFLGNLAPGQRLWIRPNADGTVAAMLEHIDVSDHMRSIAGLQPGVAWNATQVEQPARALRLACGANELWFLPIAHFDTLGLDRFLLALAGLLLQEGRFDAARLDHALFYLDAAVSLHLSWLETEPASFEVQLPAGAMVSPPGRLERALRDRDDLDRSLGQAIGKLKAAGVRAAVQLRPFAEHQRQNDTLRVVMPLVQREVGPTGADHLPDHGGLFGVTAFEDSTFR